LARPAPTAYDRSLSIPNQLSAAMTIRLKAVNNQRRIVTSSGVSPVLMPVAGLNPNVAHCEVALPELVTQA
jgi:hypothetical protein